VKLRALGTAPPHPAMAPRTPPAAPARPETVAHAVVAGRDAKGLPTSIALPRPLAAGKVALFGFNSAGSRLWAGDVSASGEIKSDGTRNDILRGIKPGTKIIASVGPDGRILALTALPPRTK
jgi:hypothetical protein